MGPRPVRKHQKTRTGPGFVTAVSDMAPIELEVLASPSFSTAREVS